MGLNSNDRPGAPDLAGVHSDRPADLTESAAAWNSDVIAEALRAIGVPYLALNPGASYRGLHDSVVNHLGNEEPTMLVCLHEEHAVAIAHGYAKVTGRPMAVALHSNVGLMHATMALFNAFCDRVPMVVLGATGPVDADRRRPWIDWIHTTADQGALIRGYTKWDDQPASVPAAVESLIRANLVATTYPHAPTYVCLDADLQEQPLEHPVQVPDVSRFQPPPPPRPGLEQVRQVRELLADSPRTALLFGRVGRDEASWLARVQLAESLGAQVLTDPKLPAAYPLPDERHAAVPGGLLTASATEMLRAATTIVSFDWVDLGGTLRHVFGADPVPVPVVHVSMDHVLHNGWSKDHFGLAPVDVAIEAHPDGLVDALLAAGPDPVADPWNLQPPTPRQRAGGDSIDLAQLSAELGAALDGIPSSLVRLPIGWDGSRVRLRHPLDALGADGGAGIGSGPGMAVGAALALAGDERVAVAVLGDGDTLMGATALWTAARHRLPLLVIVSNNRSFYNDEMHQERIARRRGRPVENRWIGQHIRDPTPDLAAMARSMGLTGIGPISDPELLGPALAEAVEAVRGGGAVLVDVHVDAADYPVDPGATGPSTSR